MTDFYMVYKNGSRAIDFFTLIVNKTLPIISKKMNKELEYTKYLADKEHTGNDASKLKSMLNSLGGHFKQYDSIFSSQMVMITASTQINYSRKVFIKNNSKKELDNMNSQYELILSNMDPIINSVEYFASLYDSEKNKKGGAKKNIKPTVEKKDIDEKPTMPRIEKLSDVVDLLKKYSSDIKNKHIPEMKKESSKIMEGGMDIIYGGGKDADDMYKTAEEILGGKVSCEYKEIIIGGSGDDEIVVVSGYRVAERKAHVARVVGNWTDNDDPKYFESRIYHDIWGSNGLFPPPPTPVGKNPNDTVKALMELCQNYAPIMVKFLDLDHTLSVQLQNFNLTEFSEYINRHSQKYLNIPYVLLDASCGSNAVLTFNKMLDDLNNIDNEIIQKNAPEVADSEIIGPRYKVKSDIRELVQQYIDIKFPTAPVMVLSNNENDPVTLVKKIIDAESKMYPYFSEMESMYDEKAQVLGDLINKSGYKTLIGPSTETCILVEIKARQAANASNQ